MTTRKYSSRSQQTTLAANLTDSATSCTVVSGSALLGGATVPAGTTFTVVIDPDTALEEIVDVTVVNTNTLTIVRGIENAGTGQAHSAGAAVRHMAIGRDFREANLHIEATGGYNDGTGAHTMHGIASGEGDVVGTLKTQTLTNKTLTAPTITNPSISGAGVDASIVFEGATADAYETTLTVVDPTQDNTITLPNTTGTVVIANAAQTLTNKTIDMTGVTLTGLSSAGMSVSSATPKNYVDSILGSATAASTSAASAATSAASAATSAGSAETSAIASAASAATSATSSAAATTSASSASTSAASALTSANSASSSATAAATSATSAAASATTAAASVATIAGYATTASNSASAAATSAASASASATAAATSASSAAASAASIVGDAAAAATSAASASTSAASALTSATSAAASATTAAASVATIAGYATTASNSASAAATSAASASTSATSAAADAASATTSASSALTSATSAATTYDNFDDRYLGAKSSPPTLDNDGNALITGALYWNTPSATMFAWSGSAWGSISSTAAIYRYRYTAAGGETSESGPDDNGLTLAYLVGYEQVYLNGVLLVRTQDYTASTGTSITALSPALSAGDVLEIITFTAFDLATAVPNTAYTAKGAILVGTAAGTYAAQAVGTNGQVLTANSAEADGVEWTTISGYSVPTLGSTSIGSGATVTNVDGLTINSTTIPTSKTLVATDSTVTDATTATAARGIGYMGIPQSTAATTGAYTIVAADAGEHIYTTATRTITIPANSSVAFPVGTAISFIATTGATVTIAITSDTMYLAGTGTTGSRTLAAHGMATAVKVDTTTWYISGNGLT